MKARPHPLLTTFVAGVLAAPWNFSAEPTPNFRWVQDSFEDFSAGTLDAAGADLFVSRQGTLRTTHRFDLNGDGHLDLIFNSSHDERRAIVPLKLVSRFFLVTLERCPWVT